MKKIISSLFYPSKSFINILLLIILQNVLIICLLLSFSLVNNKISSDFSYLDDYTIYDSLDTYSQNSNEALLNKVKQYETSYLNITYDYSYCMNSYISNNQNNLYVENYNYITNNPKYLIKTLQLKVRYISNLGIFISSSDEDLIQYENNIPYINFSINRYGDKIKFQVQGLIDRNNIIITNYNDFTFEYSNISEVLLYIHTSKVITLKDNNIISSISKNAYYKDFYVSTNKSNFNAILTIVKNIMIFSSITLLCLYIIYTYIRESKRDIIIKVNFTYYKSTFIILFDEFIEYLIIIILAFIISLILFFILYFKSLNNLKTIIIILLVNVIYLFVTILELFIISMLNKKRKYNISLKLYMRSL